MDDYSVYLKSLYWQYQRSRAICHAELKCQKCGQDCKELEVHHKTYERLGDEEPDDLVVLCRPCHREEHGLARSRFGGIYTDCTMVDSSGQGWAIDATGQKTPIGENDG